MSLEKRTIQLHGAQTSGYGEQCCPPVIDPYTWLALVGGIALATYFLREAIVMNIMMNRKKRSTENEGFFTSTAFIQTIRFYYI